MKALIIEDDKFKAEQLKCFLEREFSELEIEIRGSFQSGILAIEELSPRLVLLDMVIPNYDLGEFEAGFDIRLFGGLDILREVKRDKFSCGVIIVTQFEDFGEGEEKTTFDELRKSLADEYMENYCGAVYYHPTRSDWVPALKVFVKSVMERT